MTLNSHFFQAQIGGERPQDDLALWLKTFQQVSSLPKRNQTRNQFTTQSNT